ncbi:serine hydrolase domain-containing protein [Pseudonocardia humida]|uniref:Beta-lactamase family protein n=1 Tax=Pseudonocardia humida TaxID=2800819 RepID=A0ABT1ABH3_9PSEU|nr:serine hydrolase domain-containing protein [Pseudonocardia humida]MCO1660387.1 beta-lactamase family protein [Pseudonocardia humida]
MSDLQQQVQDLLDGLVATDAEDGLQAAVYRRGELVVDAVAGTAVPGADHPVTPDTLFFVASAAKAITATVVHVLVERGAFGYDTPVVELWPEYGARGKQATTVRHLLTHSAGVPSLPPGTTREDLTDWDAVCAVLADTAPVWAPGEGTGYHAVTFGFLLGEVVRRATGKPISQVLAEEVAAPLGVADELFLGVPEAAHARLARFVDDPGGAAVFAALPADLPLFRFGGRELVPDAALANRPDLLRHDVPGMGTASARALARMYAALRDEVDGVRLVSPARLAEITTVAPTGPGARTDRVTGAPATYGLGWSVGTLGQAPAAPTVFGMPGIGGSAAYADTATGIAVAVTKNHLNPVEMTAFEQVHRLATAALGTGG